LLDQESGQSLSREHARDLNIAHTRWIGIKENREVPKHLERDLKSGNAVKRKSFLYFYDKENNFI
jgi:hypothetical protein